MATKKKGTKRKNNLGVKNSLVNNINARRKKGKSRSKKDQLYQKKHTMKWKIIGERKNNSYGFI